VCEDPHEVVSELEHSGDGKADEGIVDHEQPDNGAYLPYRVSSGCDEMRDQRRVSEEVSE
jgi:hypothetical protein